MDTEQGRLRPMYSKAHSGGCRNRKQAAMADRLAGSSNSCSALELQWSGHASQAASAGQELAGSFHSIHGEHEHLHPSASIHPQSARKRSRADTFMACHGPAYFSSCAAHLPPQQSHLRQDLTAPRHSLTALVAKIMDRGLDPSPARPTHRPTSGPAGSRLGLLGSIQAAASLPAGEPRAYAHLGGHEAAPVSQQADHTPCRAFGFGELGQAGQDHCGALAGPPQVLCGTSSPAAGDGPAPGCHASSLGSPHLRAQLPAHTSGLSGPGGPAHLLPSGRRTAHTRVHSLQHCGDAAAGIAGSAHGGPGPASRPQAGACY